MGLDRCNDLDGSTRIERARANALKDVDAAYRERQQENCRDASTHGTAPVRDGSRNGAGLKQVSRGYLGRARYPGDFDEHEAVCTHRDHGVRDFAGVRDRDSRLHPRPRLRFGVLAWLFGPVPMYLLWFAEQPWPFSLTIKQLALELFHHAGIGNTHGNRLRARGG
jgi:hypothetical protein